jgi:hypothetical protein
MCIEVTMNTCRPTPDKHFSSSWPTAHHAAELPVAASSSIFQRVTASVTFLGQAKKKTAILLGILRSASGGWIRAMQTFAIVTQIVSNLSMGHCQNYRFADKVGRLCGKG